MDNIEVMGKLIKEVKCYKYLGHKKYQENDIKIDLNINEKLGKVGRIFNIYNIFYRNERGS